MPTHSGQSDRHSVAAELSDAIETLAPELLGWPSLRTAREFRFGENGRLRVCLQPPWRGHYADFATDERGDALDLVAYALKTRPAEALAWARAWLGTPAPRRIVEPASTRDHSAELTADLEDRIDRAATIWAEAKPVQGTLGEVYLRHRQLALPAEVEDVRYSANCPRGPFRGPALVALLRDTSTSAPCGIHRTYLAPDGRRKADRQAKRMLGRAGGAAIMLSSFEDVTHGLAIAEGLETGLALLSQGVAPLWACGSATSIRTLAILPGVEALSIYADNDAAGLGAAEACATRWRAVGREVRILVPQQAGADWADILGSAAA